MKIFGKTATGKRGYQSERGAALVTVLLISIPLLMAGGGLIMITSMGVSNTADAASETKAYYAAEAGAQQVLGVLRGNVPPSPWFVSNPMGGVAPENQITFKRAVGLSTSNLSSDTHSFARLSRWLTYDSTTDLVSLQNGMAFSASLSDPDNSKVVSFTTSGVFPNRGGLDNYTFPLGAASTNPKATLTYFPQDPVTITGSGNSTLGYIRIQDAVGTVTLTDEPFQITITQTSPWPATAVISCKLNATITSNLSLIAVTFPNQSNNIGTTFTRSVNPINTNQNTPMAVSVVAPQPNRLTAQITGYGPRAAQKNMQMLLSRFAFDMSPVSTITLRSADNGDLANFNAGSSSVYGYSGYDNAGGWNLPAIGVTSTPDYVHISTMGLPAGQIVGVPSNVQQVDIPNLPTFLQTADNARNFVIQMRTQAQALGRYFNPATPPASFGTLTAPVMTFMDGDCVLPPAGGAGLLVVTGSLTLDGNAPYSGLVLVLGGGQLIREGGGNGASLGSLLIARFNNTGDFLAPTFNSNGTGTSSIQYDSDWVRRAMAVPGPRVMAVGEF
ncbi:MAG TPA: hypothetical protein VFU37_20575 [Pyrinomonadaceae bacterium]|nr:hypothetical protein [Pyrinomonadaceae bacterium]